MKYLYQTEKLSLGASLSILSTHSLKQALKNIIKDVIIYLVLCSAVFSMLIAISQYSGFSNTVGFLKFKQDYIHIGIWKVAFYIHVFSAIIALLAGFTQFSVYILKEHKKLHRFIGRAYVINILFINFPAGMIMAFYANGHIPSKIAFIILDVLWFWFTYKAVVAIKRKDIKSHREFMIRSYALTFSAITLRTWKIILSNSSDLDPETIYMIDAWLGFVPNLLLAEWIIRKKIYKVKLTVKPSGIKNKK